MEKIIEIINKSKSFLITAHVNLEGDALGSELATYALLKKLEKKVLICNNDPTPQIYSFLPHAGAIRNVSEGDKFFSANHFDVALVLDCSDVSRTGRVQDYLGRTGSIVNLDHHISNTFFGDINWVEAARGSTCEMIYRLCQKFKIMDRHIALCLYTGVFTDTGNFTYASTDKITHRIASHLMEYKIFPHKIYEYIHSLCDAEDLRFIGRIASSLKFDARKKICWAKIRRWEDKSYDLTEVIFSIMRLLKGVEVFVLFKMIEKRKTRVNFRSRSRIDVNKVARFFGGGGHKRASGTTIDDTLEGAEKKVIAFIKRYTNGLKTRNGKLKANRRK